MRLFIDLPDGFYYMKDHELYSVDLPLRLFENAHKVQIKSFTYEHQTPVNISDDIQHVGYDDEQLGREK